jgi:hypothetical protein
MEKKFKIIYLTIIIVFFLNNIKLETDADDQTNAATFRCDSNPCLVSFLFKHNLTYFYKISLFGAIFRMGFV